MLYRRSQNILTFQLMIKLATYLMSFFRPDTYESSGILEISDNKESVKNQLRPSNNVDAMSNGNYSNAMENNHEEDKPSSTVLKDDLATENAAENTEDHCIKEPPHVTENTSNDSQGETNSENIRLGKAF